jgi:hypothetical protein
VALDPPIAFPPVEDGEPIVISASTFATYERCPEQALGRMRGVYGPESRRSFVGGLAHRIFARHLSDGPIDDAGLEAACREEIGGGMNMKMASLGMKPSELRTVIEEVGELYQRFRTMSSDGFQGAEVRLEVEPAGGVTLRGAVDAVYEEDGGVRLVDWKTGGIGEPGPQLAFYALLWAMERGDIPARVEAVSVGTGERTDSAPTRAEVEATAGRVAEVVGVVRRSWSTGAEGERIAGPWCRWCPLLDECREGTAAVELLAGRPSAGL